MSKQVGKYNLIREDIDNEYLEYFDFESMSFVNKITKGVELSSIDALTTMFFDGNDLNNYIEKIENDNEYNYTYKIIYTTNKSKEEKVLKIIWDDSTLNSISKLADGKVDFVSDYNYMTFLAIIDEIKDVKSGLARKIATSKKESYRLSDYNKKIIEVIASSKKEIPFKDLLDVFSDYKEYRALYLNFKYNDIEQNKSFKEQLAKIKQKIMGE